MLHSALAGFSLGLSLILPIGAQNAFVLRQGVARQHVFLICSICAFSDALLISAGVFGFGELLLLHPQVAEWARWGGAVFLCLYGLMSLRSAWKARHAISGLGGGEQTAVRAAMTCLAITWLNPHVYLDTIVLLGSVSTGYDAKGAFAFGAITGSFLFFYSVGFGARLLSPLFSRARAWQWLEASVGVVMLLLAYNLIHTNLG
ncbi:LysE/ArgO family amino acid transporter [Ferrimonas sp. YFM]|uniref:LysE/ArgO family amino acid transporter n=1 Tax=Ferrimonas sp. YFM TaxID=3028878 RepID=UPI0025726ED4|nr:LysE/ArgO family amino acid transporter [Ferrimonas sp. YFM]BDY04625.1 amino acid transporter [Ferrimonas sp. YFM]